MYKKFCADKILIGSQLHYEKVLITDENGVIENVVDKNVAGDDVQYFEGILSPGFINCHCHLELSHMRGLIPEKTGLIDFVFSVFTQRHFAEEEILKAIEKAEDEMIANGIVAVGDISNNALTALQKSKQRLKYYNFVEVSGWLPDIAATRMSRALEVYDLFRQPFTDDRQPLTDNRQQKTDDISFHQLSTINYQLVTGNHQPPTINHQHTSLVPHAPYSVSENLWQLLQPYYNNKTVSIHNQETSFEDELFIQGSGDFTRMYEMMKLDNRFFSPSGKSSLQTYFSKLKGAKNVLLVHNTFTKEADVLYAKKQAVVNNQHLFFCICANANLYIENALPPLEMLMLNNCNLVIGTDSLASNYSLSILDEMRTIRQHFPFIKTEQLLQMATLNGAAALSLSATLGSFERGKQPGVVLINEDFTKRKKVGLKEKFIAEHNGFEMAGCFIH